MTTKKKKIITAGALLSVAFLFNLWYLIINIMHPSSVLFTIVIALELLSTIFLISYVVIQIFDINIIMDEKNLIKICFVIMCIASLMTMVYYIHLNSEYSRYIGFGSTIMITLIELLLWIFSTIGLFKKNNIALFRLAFIFLQGMVFVSYRTEYLSGHIFLNMLLVLVALSLYAGRILLIESYYPSGMNKKKSDLEEMLKRLKSSYKWGVISEEEYQTKRKEILNSLLVESKSSESNE